MMESSVSAIGEQSQYLLELARKNGYAISATQLTRWHRAGLLPRPRQSARGKGQGTRSLYPPGTSERLLKLCAIRAGERRLPYLAWHLWWEGYAVPLQLIHAFLREVAANFTHKIHTLSELRGLSQPLLSEHVLDFVEQAALVRLAYKPLRRVRKRIGRAHFSTFLRLLLDIVAGNFAAVSAGIDPLEEAFEQDILARGLGFNFAFPASASERDASFRIEMLASMQAVSMWLQQSSWEQVLVSVNTFDLLRMRDEVRTFLAYAEQSRELLQPLRSSLPLHCQAFYEVLQAQSVIDQVLLLVLWIDLRANGMFSPPLYEKLHFIIALYAVAI